MAWRGESWAEVVARAATQERRRAPLTEREDAEALAARATRWPLGPEIERTEDGLVLGGGLTSVNVAFAQLYHVEPVDPWPSVAFGWVDGLESCAAVLTPDEMDAHAFAQEVEKVIVGCEARVARATQRGWLDTPVHAWEPVDAMPGEGPQGPELRGYRSAAVDPDPIVAERIIEAGAPSLWTWVWARLSPPRRIQARQVVLTKRFVYVRAPNGRFRLPVGTLRTSRRTEDGDSIYVFGRHTELLLVHQPDCPLTAALDARLG